METYIRTINVENADNLPEISISKGEVQRFKIKISRKASGLFQGLREGVFFRKKRNETFAYRVSYQKEALDTAGQDNNTSDTVYVTIDARLPTFDIGLQEDPNQDRIFRVKYHDVETPKTCVLAIDLGNTRTISLLVDKVDELNVPSDNAGKINIYPVPMCWAKMREDPISGEKGFESIISLVISDPFTNNDWCFDDCRMSFLRLGDFAVFNNRESRREAGNGRYTLSSPKRYYWDEEPSERLWLATRYSGSDMHPSVYALNGCLPERFTRENFFDVKQSQNTAAKLPPAAMLSAMVFELYEQAVYYVSSEAFKQATEDRRVRWITTIHITYPSTLSPKEKKYYQMQLEKGLQAYLSLFDLGYQVSLQCDIDEATSVLALYAFSEIKKYKYARFWLQMTGRRISHGAEARIAVIDVGGGTTDLSISNVASSDKRERTSPSHAKVSLIFRDGISSAGDNLILSFLKECVLDKAFDWLATTFRTNGDGPGLKNAYQQRAFLNLISGLKRNFWFPLTIGLVQKCDDLMRDHDAPDKDWWEKPDQELGTYEYPLTDETFMIWSNLNRAAGNTATTTFSNQKLVIKITPEIIKAYKKSVEDSFKDAAKTFGKAIFAFESDIVLFSGKTAELFYVQEFFKKFIPVSPMSILSMKDYCIGQWCPTLTTPKGCVSDSKISTAMGAALYTLRDKAFVTIEFDLDRYAANPNCKWGVATIDDIRFVKSLFSDDDSNGNSNTRANIPLSSVPCIYISRKQDLASAFVLSYQIRLKPETIARLNQRGMQASFVDPAEASVTIERETRSLGLKLVDCSGTYENGDKIKLDDLECRTCNLSQVFGLDDDTI